MRIVRFRHAGRTGMGEPRYGEIIGDAVHTLDGAPWLAPLAPRAPRPNAPHSEITPLAAVTLLVPATPSKIVCIGRNYAAHAKELGNAVPTEPLLFLKPPSSLLAHGGVVVLPPESERVEHEAELAVVIGTRANRVSRQSALGHVFGFTAACDVTARDIQRKDVQFTRGKGFDTFCPLGPWIETSIPAETSVACRVNGAPRQQGSTRDMVFDVAHLVAYVSHAMTLEPGDVILTGTPEGVGPLAPSDRVEVEIGGIGVLAFSVKALAAPDSPGALASA